MVREGRSNDKLPASRWGHKDSVSPQCVLFLLLLRFVVSSGESLFRSAFRLLKEHRRHNFSHLSLSVGGISWRNVGAIFLERTPLTRRTNSEHTVAWTSGGDVFRP